MSWLVGILVERFGVAKGLARVIGWVVMGLVVAAVCASVWAAVDALVYEPRRALVELRAAHTALQTENGRLVGEVAACAPQIDALRALITATNDELEELRALHARAQNAADSAAHAALSEPSPEASRNAQEYQQWLDSFFASLRSR